VGHRCLYGSPMLGEAGRMKPDHRSRPRVQAASAFAGFRFPPEVIVHAVR
jgi:hypothetical protein